MKPGLYVEWGPVPSLDREFFVEKNMTVHLGGGSSEEGETPTVRASESSYRDALDHIMRVAREGITPTRRLDWIEIRARYALEGKEWSGDIRETPRDSVRELVKKNEKLRADLESLLYAVARKFPNETRHQTALRYIREAETRTTGIAKELGLEEAGHPVKHDHGK